MRTRAFLLLFANGVFSAGCGSNADLQGDTGVGDSFARDATNSDAQVQDAGIPDAARNDAAGPDANLPDADAPDAAIPEDAAEPDSSPGDGGSPDLGALDAEPELDAGVVDAAPPGQATSLFHFDSDLANACGTETSTPSGGTAVSSVQSTIGGAAAYFDGSGDYVETTLGTKIDFASGEFTIEFWVYPENAGGNNVIVQSGADLNNRWYGQIFLGSFTWRWHAGGPLAVNLLGPPASNNVWYHYAVTRVGDEFRLYVDGQLQSVQTQTATIPNDSGVLVVGSDEYLGGTSPFRGYVDELRISQGRARYTGLFAPPISAHVCD